MKKRLIWFLGTLAVLCAVGRLTFYFAFHLDYWVPRQGRKYIASRPELSDQNRAAIQKGKILVGMSPDEAAAAGGPFVYVINAGGRSMTSVADIRYYFDYQNNPPPQPRIPPDILWQQRNAPDSTQIQLNFSNKTQFDSVHPVGFKAIFVNGRLALIEKMTTDG